MSAASTSPQGAQTFSAERGSAVSGPDVVERDRIKLYGLIVACTTMIVETFILSTTLIAIFG